MKFRENPWHFIRNIAEIINVCNFYFQENTLECYKCQQDDGNLVALEYEGIISPHEYIFCGECATNNRKSPEDGSELTPKGKADLLEQQRRRRRK